MLSRPSWARGLKYRKAGLDPVPLRQSPAMMNALEAGLRKTGMVANNLTMTTAVTTQQAFIDAVDLAYMQVSTGTMTYQSAIREGVLSLARRGLTVISFPSGRIDQADVAMRRTVLTGVAQTTGVMQLELAREMGCDLVEVDAHFGARNHGTGPMNHESWQGKIYSISGRDRRYPPLAETTGYGTVVGLYGVNCRHSMTAYIEGISEPSYSKGELREMAERKVTYNGEELTYYDATQKQRAIERAIRKSKREAGALEAAGLDNTDERVKLGHYQAKMRDFIEQTGLGRDRFREQVAGVNVRALNVRKSLKQTNASGQGAQKHGPKITKATKELKSISEYAEYNGASENIKAALSEIDKNHKVALSHKVEISTIEDSKNEGVLWSISGEPTGIGISKTAKNEMMAAIHECAHFIDLSGIEPVGKYAESKITGKLSKWWKAVTNSEAYQELEYLLSNKGYLAGSKLVPAKHLKYLLQPRELFARSYEEYIALGTKNKRLTEELRNSIYSSVFVPRYWKQEDFSQIAEAFDELFEDLGWKR